ncbi:MAG: hypothetical protein KAQ62_08240 [Cyclobacteriaceae bacterium]|nr:hypothetical protein [Cyclobacteriaceae bacterium]
MNLDYKYQIIVIQHALQQHMFKNDNQTIHKSQQDHTLQAQANLILLHHFGSFEIPSRIIPGKFSGRSGECGFIDISRNRSNRN